MTETPGAPIRVALVDDQQLVRAGFALVIGSQPDMEVVLEAGDGAQAARLIPSYQVDVVLMDVRMPQMDGIAATRALIDAAGPGAPRIVMLTTFDLDEYVLAAIRAGASGFLLKDTPPEDMLAAIRTVHAGDGVIAPSATRRLIEHVATTTPATELTEPSGPTGSTGVPDAVASLTARELEVLQLIARGRSNGEIAAELFVAEATVKTHVGRLLAKLEVRDRVQLVVLAYETGLVAPGAP
ncbi:response regulator [Serinibacter salmoneus]|uniref:LuxR family two component transcriptional regulator n=1 Tax=Serinibacter salmoneus TaxID=556530 RepID=A0A2A9CYU1_9MICO|nr:response regulator transcription factor [Serinibacter salmoneus]PFG19175.1 LuxR family two component transcriptional regulator [Serinibacter salmoneus]